MSARQFAERLLEWHARHGRHDLPWQCDDPYRVWVSEIMLQQTRVSTVIPYYERFIARFPDVAALAAADPDDVLARWSGLGYYARARNLQAAARVIRDEYGCEFPRDIESWMRLPGIGRSTAGAILAMAYGQRHPILDGNARRVLARHAGVEGWPGDREVERCLWELAETRTPAVATAAYTRAIMDLGATVCTRTRPACGICPLAADCAALAAGRVAEIPAPRPRRDIPLRRAVMLLLQDRAGSILLERRPPTGIWGGLWCLPQAEDGVDVGDFVQRHYGLAVGECEYLEPLRHAFTHFKLDILPVRARVRGATVRDDAGKVAWTRPGEIAALGLPAPVRSLIISACPEPSTA